MSRDEALIAALQGQRNEALDRLASTLADLEVSNAQLAEMRTLGARLTALEAKLPDESIQCVHEVGQAAPVAAG